MNTVEQVNSKSATGIEVNMTPQSNPPSVTISRLVEVPTIEASTYGGRVTVNGQRTYIEVSSQDDWFETRMVRGREKI